ncbi:MarR family winged helix-turn-helix transcriptional regulator [Anaeromyxobacter sp. K]|uniref:MarR family winged helix-turn-helix transcriptional regulator n=1 Tax=Anaeromyxobacter sp. (strain K) TaxID=447217 RepID=UPI001E43423F|nr:MarR family transcriptional regulator [Anaeromyxobacter sp. K]
MSVNMIDPTDPLDDASQLLFFAFRNLTAEPDRILAERGLSRVHHRVLYFVRRDPGLSPGDLLRILRVSKQALARPLRELLAHGLIASAAVPDDRRRRALTLTARGAALERRVSGAQRRLFAGAFRAAGPAAADGWRDIMATLGDQAPARAARAGARRGASRPARAASPSRR